MPETIIYQANSITSHVVDTFDPGSIKAITYFCQIDNISDSSILNIRLIHDGNSVGVAQQGLTLSNNPPSSFDANIHLGVGKLFFTPSVVPSKVTLEKTTILANNYGEHTRCGRWIRHTEGFALDNNTVVIRQANNNVFANIGTYLISNTLGPVKEGSNLIVNPEFTSTAAWIPINDIVLTEQKLTTNNIYLDNFIYQTFQANIGYSYIASANGENGKFVVGTTISDNNYVYQNLSTTSVESIFSPNTATNMFVSVGHTQNEITNVYSANLHKIVPFNTYRWDLGTFYLKWTNTAVNTVLWSMENVDGHSRQLKVNSDNNVQISENNSVFVIGPQSTGNNTIALSYGNGFVASLNGNSVVSNLSIELINNMITLEFITSPLQFSYVPTILSNTELVDLSND